MPGKTWSEIELDILKMYYPDEGVAGVAKRLFSLDGVGRSYITIVHYASKLKLKSNVPNRNRRKILNG